MMPTKEDIIYAIQVMKRTAATDMDKAHAIGERMEALLAFYDKSGLPVREVDIYLLGEVPGRRQLTQIHSYAVGDRYELLPEDDEEPVSTYYNYNLEDDPEVPADGWKIQDIRAHP